MSSTESPRIVRTRMQEVSLGMVLLGVIFSSGMFSLMLSQAYTYHRRFKKDPLSVKLVVLAVVVLNTVSMFFVGHAAWYYLVTTGPRKRAVWSLNAELALSIIMSGLSETFLAFRVFKLSDRKYFLSAILFSLASLHFFSGEVAAIKLLLLGKSATFADAKIPTYLRLGSAALCDTSVAVSLCYFLHTKRTGLKRSDEIINYLMFLSLNSGLLTSLVAVAALITYVVVPHTWVYTALCFLISRLYATTFLCSLNSRRALLNQSCESTSSETTNEKAGRMLYDRGGFRGRIPPHSMGPIDVFVVTETRTDGLHREGALIKADSDTDSTLNERTDNSSSSILGASESSSALSDHHA